jgi:hypothetical protein
MIRPLLALVALAAALVAAAPAAAADPASARRGADWLAANVRPGADGQAADALVAMRAAGRLSSSDARRRAAALRRGARRYATTAGATGKVVLGLAAAGANPRCAPGVDLLSRLRGFGRNGRYGRTVFDQTLGMLAMRTLRAGPPSSTVSVLLGARGRGGWNFGLSRSARDDVTSTAMALMAARAAGVPAANGSLRAALRWMRTQRTPSGGFGHERRSRTEANPTALAIQATRAMGARDTRAERALGSLQRGNGAFQFARDDAGSRLLATVDAVVAMAGRRLPVAVARRTPGAC